MEIADIPNLEKLFKLGKFLGITPAWNEKIHFHSKLYVLMLTVLVLIGTVISISKRYAALSDLHMSAVQASLESIECSSELFFMVSCFYNIILKEKYWKRFFYNIKKAEQMLQELGFTTNRKTNYFILRICLFHVIFILMHILEILVWYKVEEISLEYGYILYRIIMYYQFFLVYVTVSITEVIKKRYDYLNNFTNDILDKNKKVMILINDECILRRLHKIKKAFATLYLVLAQINIIFGWVLFFNFSTYVLLILGNINYILKYTQTEDGSFNTRIFVTYVLYSTIFTVSTILIVMFCDAVKRSGKGIRKSIFLHQDLMAKSWLKKELELFAEIAEELSPAINTGFFQINQSVLAMLFSAVVSYLIIIVQFSITL